ncbi:signal peptide containing protein [Theileria equi strain WA]|uniref:Signal peptide containing protein n=1 Tax=Theileria equi strain WA TaxID=1537102 RepID=L1LC05_THEEQ|nr:signal peptide containing protein [Theileria equi strain WA]EKX72804.1 signal peptide containing protein [Theileria equi strain WA]|eukprot:XP_004832256.1 signal peptide containing protein [Theileria equi strain WA]
MKFISLFYLAFIAKFCGVNCFCRGDITDGEALDLSSPDPSKVGVKEEVKDGIKWKVFTPKKDVKFTSFSEGRVEVGNIKTEFKKLRISLDSPTPIAYVEYKGCVSIKYFKKVNGAWEETTYDYVSRKVNEIKNNKTEKANEEAVNADDTFGNLEDGKESEE